MDLNLVVLSGRVATVPELSVSDTGSVRLRVLLTIRSEAPRKRIDVVPVSVWDPPVDLVAPELEVSERVWVTGAVQRRFWDDTPGSRARIEVVGLYVARGLGAGSPSRLAD